MTRDEWAKLANVPPFSLPHRLVDLLEERAAIMEEGNGWTREQSEREAVMQLMENRG